MRQSGMGAPIRTTMQALTRTLVQVYCRNPLCPFYMNKGKRAMVGRISDRAELKCHSCRQVATYEV